MRTWIFATALVAVLFGTLGFCARAVWGGGPAMLEPPPFEQAYTPVAIAAFLVLWLTLIAMLTAAELKHSEH